MCNLIGRAVQQALTRRGFIAGSAFGASLIEPFDVLRGRKPTGDGATRSIWLDSCLRTSPMRSSSWTYCESSSSRPCTSICQSPPRHL
jgi:hypothetical protein